METYPNELFRGCKDAPERSRRMGKFLVLQELGFFGEKSNITLSADDSPGSFPAKVRRKFSNIYGNTDGCEPADIEVAAEMLGVFDDVYGREFTEGE